MLDIKLQADQPALRERNGNIKSPRKVAFSASIPNTPSEAGNENAKEDAAEVEVSSAVKRGDKMASCKAYPTEEPSSGTMALDSRIPRQAGCDDMADQLAKLASKVNISSSPSSSDSVPKLSVEDKLKVAAEAASLAEASRPSKSEGPRTGGEGLERKQRNRGSPMKSRIAGRPKRRKSTLTPEELQNLIGFE
jgi:hypothetical protein